MSQYQWKMRPLLVFAPSRSQPEFARQMGIVGRHRQGFVERDMAVVAVTGGNVEAPLGPAPELGAAALRRRFGIAAGAFRVLLVGKDGGVKLSSGTAVGADRLFGLIDAMPMRRQEMRRRGQ